MADPLVEAIRRDLGRAQAAARAGREAAQERLDAARARHAGIVAAAAQVPARAAEVRDRRLRELDAAHLASVADTARAAVRAAGAAAAGTAGDPWEVWRPGPVLRGAAPGPVRVGTVPPGVPALVPFLDRAHVQITGSDRARCDAVLAALLLRTLGCLPAGAVRLTGYDPEQLGGGLAGFAPLSSAGLLTFVGPGGLGGLLDDLVDHIRRVNETVLAGEYPTLLAYAEATGRRPEHWRIAVLLGADEPTRHEQAQLARILRTGVACGVHLVLRGLTASSIVDSAGSTMDTLEMVAADRYHGMRLAVEPPPAELVTTTCRTLAAQVAAGPEPAAFADLLPDELWTRSSAAGLNSPIGEGSDGGLVEVTLADYPPHALIGGPSGTGKTNLVYAWLGGLAARYSPAELEFYLLDFKEGVSFARFAPGRRDPTWLPQVRLVGVNVNTDREFGVALHFLTRALRERAEAAKRHEVTTLAELRAEDPAGHWPRIVAVVDEFQVLLSGRDALAAEAATLLEDLARRGRSQGIHLVLASQDVSGIEALWGRSALVGQFALRMALPKARRILAENNPAAESIPRHHAVVNADSGALPGNRIVRVPAASDRSAWGALQRRLWDRRPAGLRPPRLFDGDAVPAFPKDRIPAQGGRDPVALLGETIDVAGEPARLRLLRAPGRNLAVLGTRLEEACAVLGSAGRSLAGQFPTGMARFSVACLDPDAIGPARDLHAALPEGTEWYELDTVTELLAETVDDASGTPHFLILYAIDAARTRAAGPQDHLRRILHGGPERRTHVLGWWRGVGRLRDDLGGLGARLDPIGAWVALDVHGGDLATLYPKPGGPAWYPRPWRALYFDRTVHRTAETIIPYGLS